MSKKPTKSRSLLKRRKTRRKSPVEDICAKEGVKDAVERAQFGVVALRDRPLRILKHFG